MIRSAAIWVCLALAVLCIALAATGFFIAAFYLWVAPHLGAPGGAAVTGAVLLGLAILLALAGSVVLRRAKRRPFSLLTGTAGALGLAVKLVAMLVRKDPKKALIASLLAGALIEYMSAPGRKRD